jgi:hypothetical protein
VHDTERYPVAALGQVEKAEVGVRGKWRGDERHNSEVDAIAALSMPKGCQSYFVSGEVAPKVMPLRSLELLPSDFNGSLSARHWQHHVEPVKVSAQI